jgi:hypothetical protein
MGQHIVKATQKKISESPTESKTEPNKKVTKKKMFGKRGN